MNGLYPELFTDARPTIAARALRAGRRAERRRDRRRRGARRCGRRSRSTARATSHREQLERLEEGSGQDVVELPFLFEPQLDMDAVEELADAIEEPTL